MGGVAVLDWMVQTANGWRSAGTTTFSPFSVLNPGYGLGDQDLDA